MLIIYNGQPTIMFQTYTMNESNIQFPQLLKLMLIRTTESSLIDANYDYMFQLQLVIMKSIPDSSSF
jgi:hypothetical protein